MNTVNLHQGDCQDVMDTYPDNHFSSIISDPPYEINMMNSAWDRSGIAFDVAMWQKTFRILKPGAYLLAFGSARTYHRLACAIEDAGFEIKDQIMWLHAQGYPKSKNLKGEFEGRGTSLKPSHEPIVVARKPQVGTVLQNVEQFGTGAYCIDAARIPFESEQDLKDATWGRGTDILGGNYIGGTHGTGETNIKANPKGRWPANVIHDGSEPIMDAFAEFGERASGQPGGVRQAGSNLYGRFKLGTEVTGYGDSGSIARFYFCAKASKEDRDEGLRRFALKEAGIKNEAGRGFSERDPHKKIMRRNIHPTVKPTALMQYLAKLVTPPGGLIGDFFMGSGTTGKAAVMEGFSFVGCEKKSSHFQIAEARIKYAIHKHRPQLTIFQ